MFTQCPDCQTTFRVSATVLQQAEGRVRCGGCGQAFNALEHLSEDERGQTKANYQVPEKPEQMTDSEESSTARNRQLLEMLDKLAGPEVRIEDTGVEWRVLDDTDEDDALPESSGESEMGETSSLRFVLEGNADEDAPEEPLIQGRQDDLAQPVSNTQESLDLPESDQALPPPSPGERRYDDNTILPDDFGDEHEFDELPFLVKPEAPKRRASDREAAQDTSAFDEAQVDLALGEPDEWVDLLEEVNDEDQPAPEDGEAVADAYNNVAADASAAEEAAPSDVAESETVDEKPAEAANEFPDEDMPSDIDTQFLQQAEELGLDTGSYKNADVEDEDEAGDLDEAPVAEAQEPDVDELGETDVGELASEDEEGDEEVKIEEESFLEEEDAAVELESTADFEAQISVAEKALTGEEEDQDEDSDDETEVPDELELEQDLSAWDTEDETAPDKPEDTIAAAMIGGKDVSHFFDEDSPMVETIVMEGEKVHDALQAKERRKIVDAINEFDAPGPLEDTYSLNRGKIRGGRRASDPASYTVIASVIVLGLLLIGQIMHQSRQTLATYGAFNHTIGSIYRVLGKPVTPEWDIRGWRFEATNGNVDEDEDLLTIYSRIANKSSLSLPYPLVHVSLTDRWEETIGSRMLEPNDYLAGDLDPRKPVPSNENFTAVITIESPSAEATGFRLTACYRIVPGRVRCATEDFKD